MHIPFPSFARCPALVLSLGCCGCGGVGSLSWGLARRGRLSVRRLATNSGHEGVGPSLQYRFWRRAIIVGVVSVFSSRPAGPGQEAGTRLSLAVLALDSAIQASVAATIAGWSLPYTLLHLELQAWR
jgi:hypothetical protein